MAFYIKTFLVSLVVLGALDYLWLGFIAKSFNDQQLQSIAYVQDGQVAPLKGPAVLVYLVMAFALTLFAAPQILSGSVLQSALMGAALGFALYAVFDLTNLAILKNYPIKFAVVDVAWGTVLFAASNSILFLLRDWLK